jgi:ABC-2 type transport system ATP-binding protein
MNTLTAIEARNLTKAFARDRVAVSSLDLKISPGTVFGLVGRNGAGKSTALRLLMGLLKPDQGASMILGKCLWSADRTHRARVGYVPQHQQLPGRMSLDDLGRYVGTFYEDWDHSKLKVLSKRWGLNTEIPVGRMSGGEQRKSALLLAIHSMPQVLILDEPAAGLDSVARRELLDLLIDLIQRRPETTMLISTHHIGDLARIAQEVGMMDRGRLTRTAQLDELQERVKKVQVVFPGEAPPRNFKVPGMIRQESIGPVMTAICELESEHLLQEMEKQPGIRVQSFPLSLEEIFLELFENKDWQSHATEEAMPVDENFGGYYETDHV